jgi:hypothetical protein
MDTARVPSTHAFFAARLERKPSSSSSSLFTPCPSARAPFYARTSVDHPRRYVPPHRLSSRFPTTPARPAAAARDRRRRAAPGAFAVRRRARDPNTPDAIARRGTRGDATRATRGDVTRASDSADTRKDAVSYRVLVRRRRDSLARLSGPVARHASFRVSRTPSHRIVGFSYVPGSASAARSPAGEELSCLDPPPRPSAPSSTLVSLFVHPR